MTALVPTTVSVIVPCFNEGRSIAECVRRIAGSALPDVEVLVVDGGSDDTEQAVAAVAAQLEAAAGGTSRPARTIRYVRNHDDRGKGHAVRRGIAEARGAVMAQIDADLQFLPEELPRLVAPVVEGRADVALGSRFMDGSAVRGGVTAARGAGNRAVSLYVSALFGQRMTDVLAGMKAWSRHAAEVIDLGSDNFSYEIEIPARALRAGLRVVDVPISAEERRAGESHVAVVRVGLRLLADGLRFRLDRQRHGARAQLARPGSS